MAHVLSEHRQQLRFHLGVRRALVETRAQYTTTIRGLARAHGVRLPSASPYGFVAAVAAVELGEALRELVRPLLDVIAQLDVLIAEADTKLEVLAEREPVTALLKTAPGVATVVAAAFVSVVDDARRFRAAHQVESYLGLAERSLAFSWSATIEAIVLAITVETRFTAGRTASRMIESTEAAVARGIHTSRIRVLLRRMSAGALLFQMASRVHITCEQTQHRAKIESRQRSPRLRAPRPDPLPRRRSRRFQSRNHVA